MTEAKKTKVKLTRSAKDIAARRKRDSEGFRMIPPAPSAKVESKPLKSVCVKATLRDCICGQAVGDALGVPYEFKSRDSFECAGMDGYGTQTSLLALGATTRRWPSLFAIVTAN